MPKSAESHHFKKSADHQFVCLTWFERDRRNIRLETRSGRVIFDLWDEDVTDAINSGYLVVPPVPRASDADWQPLALAFARNTGYL